MSHCIACNKIFTPAIITDDYGEFLGFEDMCSICIGIAYDEYTYEDIFDHIWVKPVNNYTSYSED